VDDGVIEIAGYCCTLFGTGAAAVTFTGPLREPAKAEETENENASVRIDVGSRIDVGHPQA
jgi:hypothetical protein